MKTFEVKTIWSTTPDCFLVADEYENNGRIALSVWSESEGPFSDITVNLEPKAMPQGLPTNFNFVDINNFPQVRELIARLGIGKPTGDCAISGFCAYPLYEFDTEAIQKYTEGE